MKHGDCRKSETDITRERLIKALFETYECLYDIDAETFEYKCYYESNSFSELEIKNSGDNFFEEVKANIPKTIYSQDRKYVSDMLSREKIAADLKEGEYYSFVYRLMINGRPVYHKIRAIKERIGDREHILLGVRNVDETLRQEKAHADALESMYQKERNHLKAVLSSAAGYLEINLTRDKIMEASVDFLGDYLSGADELPLARGMNYSDFERLMCQIPVTENAEKFSLVSGRNYLTECFESGEMRASVYFSLRSADGSEQPFRKVYFLYKDSASGDIFSFCVIYDLTEHQKKEKEFKALENELRMSRIRNFTSQMQPHFLYNALGSIQEIMLENPNYASELLGDFTVHLRSCIRAMENDDPVPFERELDNIKAYVNIEKMRFGDRLKVVYDIKTTDFDILLLSIQPLVENAIRHGIYKKGALGGTVTVKTKERKYDYYIEVRDDGVGFDYGEVMSRGKSGKSDSAGLKNIIFRLDKVMNAKVEIMSAPGSGTKVAVSIPKGE